MAREKSTSAPALLVLFLTVVLAVCAPSSSIFCEPSYHRDRLPVPGAAPVAIAVLPFCYAGEVPGGLTWLAGERLAISGHSESGVAGGEGRAKPVAQATASSVAAVGEEAAPFQSAEDFMREAKKFLAGGLYLEAADLFETVLTYKNAKHLWPERAVPK